MIKIICGKYEFTAELNDSKTAKAVIEGLPIKGSANRWGDEIYFYVDIESKEEGKKPFVSVGDVAYWPEGPALCIFFGKTPASIDERPKPASPVNIIGRITSNLQDLKCVRERDPVSVLKS